MSAFVVDQEHIRTLVWAGLHYSHPATLCWPIEDPENTPTPEGIETLFGQTIRRLDKDTASTVGQILLSENARSVNYRYDEDEHFVYDHGAPAHTAWAPVELLHALACYEYQACETPGWHRSEARAICDALRATLVRCLPGYDEGPWEITPEDLPAAIDPTERASWTR